MNEVMIKRLDDYLGRREYEEIWKYISENPDEYDTWDKSRKIMFWLSFMERTVFSENGKHGILGRSNLVAEALETFDQLKRNIQRLEWWTETDAGQVVSFAIEKGISGVEVGMMVKAFALDSQYVLDRLQGKTDLKNLFYRSDEEIGVTLEKYKKCAPGNICFICCYNNDSELKEMNDWIERLWIPEGMTLETIYIEGARSMCSGYNEAMHKSNARYKVYLHQDVRIVNPFFIYDVINTFGRNPNAGLLGMLGAESVPESGVMWQARRYGSVIHTEFNANSIAETFHESVLYDGDFNAALVDGFLIATCMDVEWREDLFNGWDFYDASQSMEFTARGMDIVVPRQETAWCLHDFGQINWSGYDDDRARFVEEYL